MYHPRKRLCLLPREQNLIAQSRAPIVVLEIAPLDVPPFQKPFQIGRGIGDAVAARGAVVLIRRAVAASDLNQLRPDKPSALLKPVGRHKPKMGFIRKSETKLSERPPPSPCTVEMYSIAFLVMSYLGVAVWPQFSVP